MIPNGRSMSSERPPRGLPAQGPSRSAGRLSCPSRNAQARVGRSGQGVGMAQSGRSRKQKSRASYALNRAVGLMAFMPLASRAPQYARLMLALIADDRTPAARKALLAGAAGYLLVG